VHRPLLGVPGLTESAERHERRPSTDSTRRCRPDRAHAHPDFFASTFPWRIASASPSGISLRSAELPAFFDGSSGSVS
jgi:hypothetical protein